MINLESCKNVWPPHWKVAGIWSSRQSTFKKWSILHLVVLVSTLDQFQMPLVATIENLIPLAELGKKSSGPLSPVLPTTGLIISAYLLWTYEFIWWCDLFCSQPGCYKSECRRWLLNQGQHSEVNSLDIWLFFSLWWCFIAGGFILGAVHNPILLVVCGGDTLFLSLQLRFGILIYWGTRGMILFISRYPDSDLRTAKDGQCMKVTGVWLSEILILLHRSAEQFWFVGFTKYFRWSSVVIILILIRNKNKLLGTWMLWSYRLVSQAGNSTNLYLTLTWFLLIIYFLLTVILWL